MRWINVETLEVVDGSPQTDGHWVMQHADGHGDIVEQAYQDRMDLEDLRYEQAKHRAQICQCGRLEARARMVASDGQ